MIEFEPLRSDHLPLLREWLGREHVSRWWRTREESVTHAEEALAGLDATDYYLIVTDGRAVGMIQTYRVDNHPNWAALVGEEGGGAAGIDLLIGEQEAVGRGLGPQVLEAFAREVIFREPDITAVIATVEEANRRSWRAFEKAGFRHVRDVEEDGLPHRLMRLERRYAQ